MQPFPLDRRAARRLVLHLQGLTRPHHRAFGSGGLEGMIGRMGFVQVDSIPHVERAHHMILHARSQGYRPRDLARLHREGQVFEGWTHDASYIPTAFWPLWKHRFRRSEARLAKQFVRWQGPSALDGCERLLRRIRDEGPLRARDLDDPRSKTMWQWSDGKAALEYLWRTGRLAISRRENFHKVYDLAERVIPSEHFEGEVSEAEFIDRSCRHALEGLGWGTPAHVARYFDNVSIAEAKAWLERQDGQAVRPISVDGRTFAARADIADIEVPDPPMRVRVLSPFDPVARDRERLSWLWGFDYRIEIYVPEAKRVWGYYVFPLLEGDRMVGRIDMRAVRAEGVLEVRRFWLEPGARWNGTRAARLDAELTRQARLAGVKGVRWLEEEPAARPT